MNSVSVIVITFNSSPTIKDCLVSLEEQTLKDIEVILVDNNCLDNTTEAVEYVKPVLNSIALLRSKIKQIRLCLY